MSGSKCLITGATGATAPPPHHSFSIKASMFVLSCIARTNDPKNFASVGRRSGRSDRSTSVIQQTSDSKADVEEGPGRVKNGSVGASTSFPLYPTKQTSTVATATSVSCHEQTFGNNLVTFGPSFRGLRHHFDQLSSENFTAPQAASGCYFPSAACGVFRKLIAMRL